MSITSIQNIILQNKADHIVDLFIYLERIFSFGGVWPFGRSYVRFAIYISYFVHYFVMAFTEFYNVSGNLELIVMSLVEATVYIMTFSIVWLIRCSNLLKTVIDEIKKDMAEREFENPEEEIIYYSYNRISKIFTYTSIVGMSITFLLLYFRPLMYFLITNQGM